MSTENETVIFPIARQMALSYDAFLGSLNGAMESIGGHVGIELIRRICKNKAQGEKLFYKWQFLYIGRSWDESEFNELIDAISRFGGTGVSRETETVIVQLEVNNVEF